jgi:hypothetical protein
MSTQDTERELASATQSALLVRRSLGTLRVTGKDRLSWLNGLTTQDLAPRKPGDAALGLFVAKNGKIEAEIAILVGNDDVLIGLPADRAASLRDKLDRYLIMEDAAIEVASEPFEWLFAFGPRAPEVLAIALENGARGGVSVRAGLPVAVLAGSPIAPAVDAITQSAGDPIVVASEAGWQRFRVERGIAERGIDYVDDESYAQEAALENDEVSFAKGCYLGQEAVFMLEKRGHVSKRLVQLVASAPLVVGAEIRDVEGKAIGKITSSAGPSREELALGIVKYKHARADHELTVVTSDGKTITARVTSLLAITPDA